MKTAVEWLIEQLTEVDYNCINKTFLKSNNSLAGYKMRELFKQAVEMEKEHIRKSFSDGAQWELYGCDLTHEERSEEYYNEIFKQEQ
jgi:hypothetical protein